jgi:hypothetical protein
MSQFSGLNLPGRRARAPMHSGTVPPTLITGQNEWQ